MRTIKSLKKGERLLLAYGEQKGELATCNDFVTWAKLDFTNSSFQPWEAEFENVEEEGIIFAKVFGFEEEYGTVYAHDVIAVKNAEGNWERIEHTDKELELKEKVKLLGGS